LLFFSTPSAQTEMKSKAGLQERKFKNGKKKNSSSSRKKKQKAERLPSKTKEMTPVVWTAYKFRISPGNNFSGGNGVPLSSGSFL